MKKILPAIFLLVFTAVCFAEGEVRVTEVIDGNTLKLTDGRTVKLIGVDCPTFDDHEQNKRIAERLGIDFEHYESYAEKAKSFVLGWKIGGYGVGMMLEGKEIRLQFDEANESINHKDKYGRTLAYVYDIETYKGMVDVLTPLGYELDWGKSGAEVFANPTLIKSGYCTADESPFRYKDEFARLEKDAKVAGREIWRQN